MFERTEFYTCILYNWRWRFVTGDVLLVDILWGDFLVDILNWLRFVTGDFLWRDIF